MPDISPELMDVVAMLEREELALRQEADLYKYRSQRLAPTVAANTLARVRVLLKNGEHIGAHARAGKGD